ncbi:MAG: hypothetical protein ACXVIY_07495 [Mucilaginibacter sp.]
MKTNYLKGSMLLITTLAIAFTANAQNADSAKHNFDADRNNNFHYVDKSKSGQRRDRIRTNWHDNTYEMTLVNKQMTELYVDGEKIPQANWGKYSTVIAAIREQIRKDEIQAAKDQAQARLDQMQARRDQQQAKLDQQQAQRDQEQAQRDQEQAHKEQAQARVDEEQAKKDEEQAQKDQEQARKDQQQARLDQEQARKDQEQARLDQVQARKDQELMRQLIADLVSDKIVPGEKSLKELTLDSTEMTVNGLKQPDEVFKRYKDKYKRFAGGEFSYENSGNSHGIHMSRNSVSDN